MHPCLADTLALLMQSLGITMTDKHLSLKHWQPDVAVFHGRMTFAHADVIRIASPAVRKCGLVLTAPPLIILPGVKKCKVLNSSSHLHPVAGVLHFKTIHRASYVST